MGKVKSTIMDILECDSCYGYGWQFAGNAIDYDVWACECNPYNISADNLIDWKRN